MLDWGSKKGFRLPGIIASYWGGKLLSNPRHAANCRPIGEYGEKFSHEMIEISDKVLSPCSKKTT